MIAEYLLELIWAKLFSMSLDHSYIEKFAEMNLQNKATTDDNVLLKILIDSPDLSSIINMANVNQDSTVLKIVRNSRTTVDTINRKGLYCFDSSTKNCEWIECSYRKDLEEDKKLIALSQLQRFLGNMIKRPMNYLLESLGDKQKNMQM